MAASHLLSDRILDVRECVDPRMSAREVAAMTQLVRRLARSSVGKRLLEVALTSNVRFSYASSLQLWFPGRGVAIAQYRPGRKHICIGRRHAPDLQLVALAHELQHFCDEVLGWDQGSSIQSEVRANQSEAIVAIELGLCVPSRAVTSDMQLISPHAIAAELRASRFYAHLADELPRLNGRIHSVLSNDELRDFATNRARVWSVPVLVAGPAIAPVRAPGPTDTAWLPSRFA